MLNINRYKCGYCGACVGICPDEALELVETCLEVNKNCTDCGTCIYICPMGALRMAR